MALAVADRVKESTTTTGTGTVNLAGAETGFQTFVAGIGNSNTTYYAIVDGNTGDFEVGIGTVTDASPDTLSRDTILQSSNSDSAVNFGSGTKSVFCTQPADKAVFKDASGHVELPDSAEIRLGDNTDLKIRHNGSNNQIQGFTGQLQITNFTDNNDVRILTDDGSGGTADYFRADGSNGEAVLYHYGTEKLATKSTGVDVVGNITVSGTVDGRDLATDGTKLDGVEASADVTDTTNVTAAGALMDSEVTNLAQVKAFDSSDYATAAQGTTADNALPKAGGTMTGNLSLSGTNTRINMPDNHVINRRFELDAVDASGVGYVLLCRNAASNDVNGRITMDRTSGLRHACQVDIIVSSGSSTNPIGSLKAHGVTVNAGSSPNGPSYELVTVTYDSDSNSYVALKITNPDNYYETSGAFFTGRLVNSGSNTLLAVLPSGISNEAQLADANAKHTFQGDLDILDNIVIAGTVDGRDIATDGTKLDGIESNATADQTAAEIRTLVESASDSNVFTDADHTKLNGIESNATADQTASEILTAIKTVDGAGSGLDADTLDGTELAALATDAEVAAIQQDIYNTAGAQYTLNGGGVVTVTNGNKIKWDTRILAIPVEKDEFSSSGYIQINPDLTSGTITYYSGTSGTTTSTLDSDGITMPSWSGLYYQVTPGQSASFSQSKLRLVAYTNSDWEPEEGWLLLAVNNADAASAGITFLPNGGVKFPKLVTSTFDTDAGVPSWLLPSSGGTMTGDLTGTQATTSASWTVLERFFANPAAESGEQTDVRLINDLAGFNKWGTETLTNVVTSHQGSTALTTLGNAPFDGYSSHKTIYQNANGDPNVILLELPHELTYSCWVGIVFGATNWRAKSVKIETFRNGAYQTECDLTNQPSHIVARRVANNNNNGVSKIRITLDDYQNTSSNYCRIHTIFAVNYRAGNNGYGGVHYLSRFEDDEHYSNIAPATDSTYALGTTSKRYSNVYSDALDVAGNIVVSGTVDGRDLATDGTKLDGIEASADVTDTANVTSAGALMTSGGTVTSATTPLTATTSSSSGESAAHFKRSASNGSLVTFENSANVTVGVISTTSNDLLIGTGDTGLYFEDSTNEIEPFNPTNRTSTNGVISLGASTRKFKDLYLGGNITVDGTVDGRDLATDGTKLDGIEASADVTDATNVAAAGALMKTGGTMTGNLSIESAAPALILKDTTDNDDQAIQFVDSSGSINYQIGTANLAGGFHDAFSIINNTSNNIEIVDGSTKVVSIDGNGIDVTGDITISGTDIFHQLEGDATNGAGFKNREIVSRGVFTTGTGACASQYTGSQTNNVIPAGNPNGYFFSNVSFLNNYLIALPISIPGVDESTTTSINSFVFRIGSSGVSADTTIGIGLYTLNKYGLPSQLVSQGTAAITTSTTALSYIEITPSVTAITPGRYALCIANLGASVSHLAHNFTGGSGASPITDGFFRATPGSAMSCGLLWNAHTGTTMPSSLATVTTEWNARTSCPLVSVSLGTAYSGE